MFYDRQGAPPSAMAATRVALDLSSGVEREIGPAGARPSPDGRKIYFASGDAPLQGIVERDLQTGADRVVLPVTNLREWHLTADGATIVVILRNAETRENLLVSHEIAGADTRTLLRHLAQGSMTVVLQDRASKSMIVTQRISPGADTYWWVPLDGRSPRRLTELAAFDRVLGFDLHPAGRRLTLGITDVAETGHQIRVLENVVPVAAVRR
jgi:hypothetical protein